MKEQLQKKALSYRIDSIDIIEKSLSTRKQIENDVFLFNVKTQSFLDDNKRIVIIIVVVSVFKNEKEDYLAKIGVAVTFGIENYEDLKMEDGTYNIPLEFENTLKQIGISTTRGILYSELRGTRLHGAIMPIITVDTLKQEDGDLLKDIIGDQGE
jgi:hypothetical protein